VFEERLKTKTVGQLVYVDEAGSTIETSILMVTAGDALRKRTRQGQLRRSSREPVCPNDLEGSCNRDLFEMWLEVSVAPVATGGCHDYQFPPLSNDEEIADADVSWYLPRTHELEQD